MKSQKLKKKPKSLALMGHHKATLKNCRITDTSVFKRECVKMLLKKFF